MRSLDTAAAVFLKDLIYHTKTKTLTFMRSVKTLGPFLHPSDKNIHFQQLDECGCTLEFISCQKTKKEIRVTNLTKKSLTKYDRQYSVSQYKYSI